MKGIKYLYGLLAFVMALQACNDNKKAKNYNYKTLVDQQGMQFIQTADEAGLTEIKASNVALKNSTNQRIISFANMMVKDHTKVGNELKSLAKSQYVDETDTIKMAHKKAINSLTNLSGADFDRAYMHMMVKDHVAAVQLFEWADQNKNSHIQKFVEKILPTLKMHLDSANAINGALK